MPMSESSLRGNIRKLILIRFFESAVVVMPVITLFFQENGLSLSEIFFLQSIFGIGMFLFEVPT